MVCCGDSTHPAVAAERLFSWFGVCRAPPTLALLWDSYSLGQPHKINTIQPNPILPPHQVSPPTHTPPQPLCLLSALPDSHDGAIKTQARTVVSPPKATPSDGLRSDAVTTILPAYSKATCTIQSSCSTDARQPNNGYTSSKKATTSGGRGRGAQQRR